jgi:hypothetical protein
VATDIAFIGRMRSGKDTAGARLVEHHGYTRLAFADPLKDAALALDPIVGAHRTGWGEDGTGDVRLSELVRDIGWDRAKSECPEVRRTLQRMGQGVRALDPDFWLNILAESWRQVAEGRTVVTDVRYRNEADMLRTLGFKLVRIIRPADASKPVQAMTGRDISEGIRAHRSETELANYTVDACVYNGGSLAELYQRVDALTQD